MADFRVKELIGGTPLDRPATLEEQQYVGLLGGLNLSDIQRQKLWESRSDQNKLAEQLRQQSLTDDERQRIWDARGGKVYKPVTGKVPGIEALPTTRTTQKGGFRHPVTTMGELPPPPAPPSVENIPTDFAQRGMGFLRDVGERSGIIPSERFAGPGGRPLEEPIADFAQLVPGAAEDRPGQTALGAVRGVADAASGLTSTENAALLGTLGPIGTAAKLGSKAAALTGRAVSAYFAAEMAKGTLDTVPGLRDRVASGDIPGAIKTVEDIVRDESAPELARRGAHAVVNGLMTYLAGKHALGRGGAAARTTEEPFITPEVLPPLENLPTPPPPRTGWERVRPTGEPSVTIDMGPRQIEGPRGMLEPPPPPVEVTGPALLTGRAPGFEPLREPAIQPGGEETIYQGAPGEAPAARRVFTMGTEPPPAPDVQSLRGLAPLPEPPGMFPGAGVGVPPVETIPPIPETKAPVTETIRPEAIPRPAPLAQAERRLVKATEALTRITDQVRKPNMQAADLWDIPRWRRARVEVDRAKDKVALLEKKAKAEEARAQAQAGGVAAFTTAMQRKGEGALGPMPVRETASPVVYGNEVEIRVPGEDTVYRARYASREATDLVPSHNPITFQPNPAYQYTNTRQYSDPRNQESILDYERPGKFNRDYLLMESPTAEHGAPVDDPNGNAVGGSKRTILLKRIYANSPQLAEYYRQGHLQRAAERGLDPAKVAQQSAPILTRELIEMPADPQRAIMDMNKKGAAAYTESEEALAGASQVSTRTVDAISSRLDLEGEGGTMADVLAGERGVEILNMLVEDGAIPPTERGSMLNEKGDLTVEARGRIQKLTLGGLFRNPDQMDRTPVVIRAKLERAAGSLIRSAGQEGWSLLPRVQEALDVLEEAKANKVKNLGDLSKQLSLTGEPRYSEQAVDLARVLRDEPTADIGPAFRDYADAEAFGRTGDVMFGAPDQTAAFKSAFSQEAFKARREARAKLLAQQKKTAANPSQGWATPEDIAAPAPGDLGTEGPSWIGETAAQFLKDEGGWSSFELEALKGILERDWEGMRRSAARARKALKFSGPVAANYRRVWLKNPDAGWFSRAFDHPMYIAWKHPEFRPVLKRAMEMDHEGRSLAADLAKRLKPYLELRPEDQHAVDEHAIEARLTHQRLTAMDMSRLTDTQRAAVEGLESTMDAGFDLMADNTVNLATKGRVSSAAGMNSPQDIFAEVSQTGLSTKQAREVASEAWSLLEHFREQKRAGYVPFARFGQYHFGVVDKATGKPLYWGAEKNLANATGRLEELRQRFQNEIGAGTAEVIEPKEKVNVGSTLLDGLNGMEIGWISRLAKIDPELGEAFQQQADAFTRRMGFRSHLNRATDVPGFERDLRRSLVDYTLGVSRYIAKSKGLRDMRADAAKIPITSWQEPLKAGGGPLPSMQVLPAARGVIAKPKLAKYTKNYIDYQADPGYEAQFLRSALFHYYLGMLNVKSAAVNLSQVPMMTAPWLMQYANPGRVAHEISRAYKDVAAAITPSGLNYDALPVDVRDAARASHEAGTVGQQGWQELAGIQFGVHPLAEQFGQVSSSLFSATEHTNRLVSHIAAQRIFEQRQGSPKLAEFSDKRGFAESVVDNTQLAYGKWNRPAFARSKIFGLSTAPLMIFRSFTKGYMEMLHKLYVNDPKATAAAVAVLAGAAGMQGLPFMQDLEDVMAESYRLKTGDKIDLHAKSHEIAAEVFGSQGADAFLHGVSSFLPWDVSGSLGMGRIIPVAAAMRGDLRGLSAMLEVPGRMTEGLSALMQDESTRGGELLAPRAVSQTLRAGRYADEGLRTQGGAQVMLPGDRTELTGTELAGQALGFTPTAVRQARERQAGNQALAGAGAHKRQVMLRAVAKAYDSGDQGQMQKALDAIIAHDEKVPFEDQIGLEGVNEYIKSRMEPPLTRELQELPLRKRMKWLEQQKNWPGYEQLAPMPAPPR
jgi:DdrB-like nuclease